tara:strand:+ start:707 stop:922 length:216 start_codon:yes stop_codon:yes gene_type:complete
MAAMKELLLEELEMIDDNFKYSEDFYTFSLGMMAMTRILAERTDYSNESQVYMLKELQAVRDMWMEMNQPK